MFHYILCCIIHKRTVYCVLSVKMKQLVGGDFFLSGLSRSERGPQNKSALGQCMFRHQIHTVLFSFSQEKIMVPFQG